MSITKLPVSHVISAVVLALLVPIARCDDVLDARYRELNAQFAEKLNKIAKTCDEHSLAKEALVTRDWIIDRHPGRQYIFLPVDDKAKRPTVGIAKHWHDRFRQVRGERADALFELAQSYLDSHQPTRAFQLLHEVLRENPDHKDARRVLGFGASLDSPMPHPQVRATRHGKFGWAPRKHWQANSPHFRISTNHSAKAAIDMAMRLEQLHTVWHQVFFRVWSSETALKRWFKSRGPQRSSIKKLQVVLFRSREEYHAALAEHNRVGAVTEGIFIHDLRQVWLYNGGEIAQRTAYHEVTHQLFAEAIIRLPNEIGVADNFWITEGIALYMESLAPRKGFATLGGFDARRLQFARYWIYNQQYYMPLEDLASLGMSELQKHKELDTLYSQSAGLTHFLMDTEGGKYRRAVIDCLDLVYAQRERPDTLSKLLGVDLAQIDKQYPKYLWVTDNDLIENINPPEHVTTLLLGGTDISDKGVAALKNYKHLHWLDLTSTKITNASLPVIGQLTNLEELWLGGTKITDEGLDHLQKLTKLKRIILNDSQTTPAGIARLKRKLPSLELD